VNSSEGGEVWSLHVEYAERRIKIRHYISPTVYNTKGTHAHTQRELIQRGASRASKDQEALWPPFICPFIYENSNLEYVS